MMEMKSIIILYYMPKQFRLISLAVMVLGCLSTTAFADQLKIGTVALSVTDRVLILAPHPDDEVLGAAGIIQRAVAMRLPVKIVYLTYGDSNQWSFLLYRKHPVVFPGAVETMGVVRHDEAINASRVLGVNPGLTETERLTVGLAVTAKQLGVGSIQEFLRERDGSRRSST